MLKSYIEIYFFKVIWLPVPQERFPVLATQGGGITSAKMLIVAGFHPLQPTIPPRQPNIYHLGNNNVCF